MQEELNKLENEADSQTSIEKPAVSIKTIIISPLFLIPTFIALIAFLFLLFYRIFSK